MRFCALEANWGGFTGKLPERPRIGIPRGWLRKFGFHVLGFGRWAGQVGSGGVGSESLLRWCLHCEEGSSLTLLRTKWRLHESWKAFCTREMHKGNEFLAGSTMKERNVVFLQDFLSWNIIWWIKNCYIVFFAWQSQTLSKKSFIFFGSRHQRWAICSVHNLSRSHLANCEILLNSCVRWQIWGAERSYLHIHWFLNNCLV